MKDDRIMDPVTGLPFDPPDLVFESYRYLVGMEEAAKVPCDLLVETKKGLRKAYKGDYIVKNEGELEIWKEGVFRKVFRMPQEGNHE